MERDVSDVVDIDPKRMFDFAHKSEDDESEDRDEEEDDEDCDDDSDDDSDEDESEPTSNDVQPMSNENTDSSNDVQDSTDDATVKDAVSGELSESVDSEITFQKTKLKDKIANDPDSFTERWKRKRMIRQGYVILITMDRDPKTGYFTLDKSLIKKSDLPIKAVPVTNEKDTYALDNVRESIWYQQTRQAIWDRTPDKRNLAFTARDAALYMTSNKIDNALITHWTSYSHIDVKKWILPILIGAGVLIVFLMIR